jgi:hypothetical protein
LERLFLYENRLLAKVPAAIFTPEPCSGLTDEAVRIVVVAIIVVAIVVAVIVGIRIAIVASAQHGASDYAGPNSRSDATPAESTTANASTREVSTSAREVSAAATTADMSAASACMAAAHASGERRRCRRECNCKTNRA